MNVEILNAANDLAEVAARTIVERAQNCIDINDRFSIALSGGSTPKRLYELLANPDREFRSQMPWDRTIFFWTDERHVAPDHPDSNYRMTNEAMLSHVPVPASSIHRFLTENSDADDVASEYQKQLASSFNDTLPGFDLVLLGLGPDGHTASLFPGTTALSEVDRWVVANWVEKFKTFRLTMTLPVLNNAEAVMFLVSGQDKAEILKEVMSEAPAQFPAQLIKPTHGDVSWLVDKPAASKL